MIIHEWAQQMKRLGVVQSSNSPIASPIVLVKAKGKKPRPTMDYQILNKHIICEDYPYMTVSEAMDALSGAHWFSGIDFTMAFYSIKIKPEDRWKTAFRTHSELLELTRLPMGLKLSPKAMQKVVDRMIAAHKFHFLIGYIDDIMCYSQTWAEHINHLDILLKLIIENGFKLNAKKCQFFRKIIKFLGHIISSNGIQVDPERVKAIADLPVPRNVKDIRKVLGAINFCRSYVDSIGRHAQPLYKLLKKNTEFKWTTECEIGFNQIKKALMSAPVLTHPKENCMKIIQTDSSDFAIGGFLGQLEDGKVRVIAYFSKSSQR